MPEFLRSAWGDGTSVSLVEMVWRLAAAMVLGGLVAGVYRATRKGTAITASFPVTLVLLAILIAMVTQVIGDSVARAFSLVGALSIVRFRTVVRDTQDTAYVIFAVVVGMAVGANHFGVAIIGIGVVGFAAYLMMARAKVFSATQPAYLLSLRVALGHDLNALLGGELDRLAQERELISVTTAKQGVALEVSFAARLRPGCSPDEFVKALNRIEGVQRVELHRRGYPEE